MNNIDFSLVGTWVGAIAGVAAVIFGIYAYKKNKNQRPLERKTNTIDISNKGKGDISITAKQKNESK